MSRQYSLDPTAISLVWHAARQNLKKLAFACRFWLSQYIDA